MLQFRIECPRDARANSAFAALWAGTDSFAGHYGGMIVSEGWTEILRCSSCAVTGVACLSQEGTGSIRINELPTGFKAVSTEYGDTFFCESCSRPAGTSLK